jgi:hypothetical protein
MPLLAITDKRTVTSLPPTTSLLSLGQVGIAAG